MKKNRQHNGQQFENTTGVTRSRMSKNNRQHNGQQFEDTTGVTRSRISKNSRQHNGQKFQDTKGVTKVVYRRRADNIMATRLKILKV